MDLETLQKDSYKIAFDHGFWEATENNDTVHVVSTKLMLIVAEVSEALEEVRKGNWSTTVDNTGKLHGVPVELADVQIRLADLAEFLGVDLSQEVEAKQAYNLTRPYKHGKAI